jgi:ferredoxin
MNTAKYLIKDGLSALAARLLADGNRVVAPVQRPDGTCYRLLRDSSELGADVAGLPAMSLKGVLFPPTEPLFGWERQGNGIAILPESLKFTPTVVLGARPCDAAALEVVDKVMGWDYRDEFWFKRREATTVVSLACNGPVDRSCFCTAVGLGPDATRGSDLLLIPVEGGFQVEVVTPKGAALVQAQAALFAESSHADDAARVRQTARQAVEANLSMTLDGTRDWLAGHFEDPFWAPVALRCHGCGACASVCPTCHCFDIVDEPEGLNRGVRRRNWDTCQAGKFTVHASGHNPRADQNARFRQRVMHKFSIYPVKFGDVLCTGCGRCARACPGGQDIVEVLAAIQQQLGA